MSSMPRSAGPAQAYDAFLPGALEAAGERRPFRVGEDKLPALFLSHGAPPVLDDPVWIDELCAVGQSLPLPRGILVVSAHWERSPLAIGTTSGATPLYYDFWGFPARYYTLTYPTPDADEVGRLVTDTLAADGGVVPVQDGARGLDHGAFIPLMAMYPRGDVPVLQLSLPTLEPGPLLELGRRLRPLRELGVLIVGSGYATHSLEPVALRNPTELTPFNREFDDWLAAAIDREDVDELTAFATRAPGVARAHPTHEHFAPLFVVLGAGEVGREPIRTVITGIGLGNSKRSLRIG